MDNYKILDHITDLKIQGFGKTKQELFLNILKAMAESQKAEIRDKKQIKRKVKLESGHLDNLLVDFLSEVLYLSQTNKEVYNDIKFEKLIDKQLEGRLLGSKVESFGEDIKAVTYHGLKIEKNKNGLYQATVLFDI
jgi:SHS2 domain-containing protein